MKLNNETIKKLTIKELNDLGCANIGIMPVRGIAKQRVKGLKTTLKTDTETHYEGENIRWELIKTQSVYDDDMGHEIYGYVVRRFIKATNTYDDFVQILTAIGFVK